MIWDRIGTLTVHTGGLRKEFAAIVAYLNKMEKEADYNGVSITKTSDKEEEVILKYMDNEYCENEIIYKKNDVTITISDFDVEKHDEVNICIETKNETDFVADFYFLVSVYNHVIDRVSRIFSDEVCDMMKKYDEEERSIRIALFS